MYNVDNIKNNKIPLQHNAMTVTWTNNKTVVQFFSLHLFNTIILPWEREFIFWKLLNLSSNCGYPMLKC